MATVNAAQGVGGAVVDTVDPTTSTDAASAAEILPDPVTALQCSGDPGAELAALAVKSGEQQQTNAQAARDTEQHMEVSEDNQQVAAMDQKANDIRSAGLWEGAGMMAEGAGSIASAFTTSTKWGDGLKGAGKAGNGAAIMVAAQSKAAGANDDADAAAAKSASDQAKSAADDLHDAKTAAGAFISAALDFYREYTSAQASAKSAALHRA